MSRCRASPMTVRPAGPASTERCDAALGWACEPHGLGRVLDDLGELDRRPAGAQAAVLDPGQHQQVLDQGAQPDGVAVDDVEHLVHRLRHRLRPRRRGPARGSRRSRSAGCAARARRSRGSRPCGGPGRAACRPARAAARRARRARRRGPGRRQPVALQRPRPAVHARGRSVMTQVSRPRAPSPAPIGSTRRLRAPVAATNSCRCLRLLVEPGSRSGRASASSRLQSRWASSSGSSPTRGMSASGSRPVTGPLAGDAASRPSRASRSQQRSAPRAGPTRDGAARTASRSSSSRTVREISLNVRRSRSLSAWTARHDVTSSASALTWTATLRTSAEPWSSWARGVALAPAQPLDHAGQLGQRSDQDPEASAPRPASDDQGGQHQPAEGQPGQDAQPVGLGPESRSRWPVSSSPTAAFAVRNASKSTSAGRAGRARADRGATVAALVVRSGRSHSRHAADPVAAPRPARRPPVLDAAVVRVGLGHGVQRDVSSRAAPSRPGPAGATGRAPASSCAPGLGLGRRQELQGGCRSQRRPGRGSG